MFLHGEMGVDIFFGLSGYLICSRLLAEEYKTGTISLRNFYIRRFWRIQPAAFAYLVAIAIISLTYRKIVQPLEWLSALLMFRNYTALIGHITTLFTGHFWSLSVEEHFYLFFPSLLVRINKKYRMMTLALVALLVIVNRAIQYHFRPHAILYHHTDIRLDALLVPAMLAIYINGSDRHARLKNVAFFWPLALGLLFFAVIYLPANSFWHETLFAAAVPIVIIKTTVSDTSWIFRILESAPLRWIGRLSYSIYLWQTLFFTGGSYPTSQFHGLDRFPVNIFVVMGIASVSYYFIERPTMRLGHKLTHAPVPASH